jgi:hypothetical protein
MGLFMVTAEIVATYGFAIFGPKLSLQNKIKTMKAKMKVLLLTHNDDHYNFII